MPPKKSSAPTPTTSQSLGAILKSARDIMRKDKGLNGDLDRLPLLTWIMFLKFLDDLELQREDEAKLAGSKFKAAIEKPYGGGTGQQIRRGSRVTNCSRSSIMRKARGRTARKDQA